MDLGMKKGSGFRRFVQLKASQTWHKHGINVNIHSSRRGQVTNNSSFLKKYCFKA